MKKYLLTFKGNKQELHEKFKQWCEEEGQSMNTTILDLIEKHLRKFKK